MDYKSKTQASVTLSCTEAELVGLSMAVQCLSQIANILEELRLATAFNIVYCDNHACLKFMQVEKETKRMKRDLFHTCTTC